MSQAKTGETQQLAFRLTHAEVAWLQAEADRLAAEIMVPMTMTSVVRRLIAMAMKGSPMVVAPAAVADARQLAIPGAVAPVAKVVPVVPLVTKTTPVAKVVEAPKTTATLRDRVLDAARVAVKNGKKQSEIWQPAGVSQGSFSRFLKDGTHVSDARLESIAKVLGVK